MSEFEMAYLLQEMLISRTAQISLLISIMSAFMVVGYTAAHRLTIALNALIVVLYFLLIFPRILSIVSSSGAVMGLTKAMRERFAKGNEFQWNPNLAGDFGVLGENYDALNAFVWWSLFLASIAFYFLARHMNLRLEREAAAKLASVANAARAKPQSSETQASQP